MAKNDSVSVLIVDDDRATQRLLADALSKQGFSVTVEREGEWALKTFARKPFDAVLLDLLLPSLNGYEVAKKIRESSRGRKTPIIMISGVYKSALHQKEAVLKHGAYAFLEKPIRLKMLYETLRAALGDRYPSKKAVRPPPPPPDDEVTSEKLPDQTVQDEVTLVETQAKPSPRAHQLRGSLPQRPFPEVLAEIYRWRGTGGLLLRREKVKKIVYFRQGIPTSVKSNLLGECLGRVMVREKMISETECEESVKRMKSSSRQQGTVLIEMGCISPHNLSYALSLQLQTKLFDVFSWQQGDFQFNPDIQLPADTVQLEMTTAAIIYEGVRRCFDEARLAKAMGDVSAQYPHPSENPLFALQDAGLGEDEQQLLQAADGHKTVATLRALSLLSPLDTDRFVYAMKCAQMVELRDKPAEGKPKVVLSKLVESMPRPPPLPPIPSGPRAKTEPEPARAPAPKPAASAPLPLPWDAGPTELNQPAPAPAAKAAGKVKPSHPPPPPPVENAPKPSRAAIRARAAGSLLPELGGEVDSASSEDSHLRERLAAKASELRKMDYFEVLGVSRDAGREEIKRAYFALAKEYHPDKHFGSSSAEVRQLAAQIYEHISTAHDVLAEPSERERYLRELSDGVKRDIGDEVGRILAAEGKFQKGEDLLRDRNYKAAHQMFAEAIELYADEGEFHAYLGWSSFQLDPQSPENIERALRSMERAVTLNPKVDKTYLFTGYIYKATGRPDKAEKQFEKAIQCNPDCTEALRELRILGKARK